MLNRSSQRLHRVKESSHHSRAILAAALAAQLPLTAIGCTSPDRGDLPATAPTVDRAVSTDELRAALARHLRDSYEWADDAEIACAIEGFDKRFDLERMAEHRLDPEELQYGGIGVISDETTADDLQTWSVIKETCMPAPLYGP